MINEPIEIFIEKLKESGITLVPNGEKLKIRGAKKASNMDLIKERKDEILSYFSKVRDEADKNLRGRGWVEIWSEDLKRFIYIVRNMDISVPDSTLPRYTFDEIEDLKAMDDEGRKLFHKIKDVFDGEIKSLDKEETAIEKLS